MGLNTLEIGGLVVIAIAAIMQVSAVATLKWQTYESTAFGSSGDLGLFRGCSSRGAFEQCTLTADLPDKQGWKL